MRSARYFAADHGVRLPKRDSKPSSNDPADVEEDETDSPNQRRKPDWFLHDDRDMDTEPPRQGGFGRGSQRDSVKDGWDAETEQDGGSRRGGGRGGRGGGRSSAPGRTLPLLPQTSQWHYIDPEGKEQGPFEAKKLINWVDLGYFGQSDLQVRKAGKDVWGSLSDALPQIRKEAAGDFSSSHDRQQEPVRAAQVLNDDQPDRGRGRGRGQRGGGRAGRGRRNDEELQPPVLPEGRRHPAEGLLSPRDGEEADQRRYGRRGSDHVTPGPEPAAREPPVSQPAAREPLAREPVAREPAARGGRGRGRGRGGRGARNDPDSRDGEQPQRAAKQPGRVLEAPRVARSVDPGKTAWKLFTAERKGAEEPTWRYIDPDGQVQGPFNAKEMHTWLESNYLQMELPVCGMERKVSPPDLPPKSMYKTLGELMKQVEQGRRFIPVTVRDVASAQDASKAQGQNRPSSGADSVEAKLGNATTRAEAAAEQAARNEDAESVEAKASNGSPASDDDSEEEGEIAGRTAATDEEDSDYEPDEPVARANATPPRAQPQQAAPAGQPAPAQQPASNPASPERPASPQKAEGHSTLRQPASPEPVQEAAASPQAPGSPQAAPVQAPASPEAPVSPQKPETHAAKAQHTTALSKQPADSAVSTSASASPSKTGGPHTSGTTGTAGTAGPSGEAGPAGPQAAEADAAQSTTDMIVEEPEEEQSSVSASLRADSIDDHQSMQIEDVSAQQAKQAAVPGSGTQATESAGVMNTVSGAVRSLFGGKDTKEATADEQAGTSRAETSEPTVEEPDTTESETTVDSHYADQGNLDIQEETNDSVSTTEGTAHGEGLAPAVANVQEGMQKVSLEDQ